MHLYYRFYREVPNKKYGKKVNFMYSKTAKFTGKLRKLGWEFLLILRKKLLIARGRAGWSKGENVPGGVGRGKKNLWINRFPDKGCSYVALASGDGQQIEKDDPGGLSCNYRTEFWIEFNFAPFCSRTGLVWFGFWLQAWQPWIQTQTERNL